MSVKRIMKKKVWKSLQYKKFVNIDLLKLATLPQVIVEIVKVVYIGIKRPLNLPQVLSEVMNVGQVLPATLPLIIAENMLISVDLGNNRPAALPIATRKQELMLKGGLDIGLIPSNIYPITKFKAVDC